MIVHRSWIAGLALGFLIAGFHGRAVAFPVDGDQTTLPSKTELNEDALDKPREVFRSEIAGGKSYMINLGNLAFSSAAILGGVARQAGVSCGTCHVNGAGNAKFFMPKMSTRPGNFDTHIDSAPEMQGSHSCSYYPAVWRRRFSSRPYRRSSR